MSLCLALGGVVVRNIRSVACAWCGVETRFISGMLEFSEGGKDVFACCKRNCGTGLDCGCCVLHG